METRTINFKADYSICMWRPPTWIELEITNERGKKVVEIIGAKQEYCPYCGKHYTEHK